MSLQHSLLLIVAGWCVLVISGCTDDTSGLKHKIAELEKKVEKQQKEMGELASRFSPQKDFSADIQRIEDQQERISEILKTQVEPVNSRLEEFREWAQEAQKERDEVKQKLNSLGQASAESQKSAENASKEVQRLMRDYVASKKKLKSLSDEVEGLAKGLTEMRKDLLDNNTKLVAAVKKTLPKVRDAAVEQLRERLVPLEKTLTGLQSGLEHDRKVIESLSRVTGQDFGKEVRALTGRLKELEEIMASQKAYLLEIGAKVHDIETQLRRLFGHTGNPGPVSSR
jgi:DNA repair exonuclease SbcCD ATPase subunit